MHPYFLLAPLMLQTQDPHTGVIKRLMAEDFAFLNDESIQQMIEKLLHFGHINI